MKKISNLMSVMFTLVLTIVASMLGGGVVMAAAADLPDAGKTAGGTGGVNAGGAGVASTSATTDYNETTGAITQVADEDFLDKEIDRKITKIRPMSTPIDQISRYAESSGSKQFDFKYFSVGTRPIKTTLAANITATQSGATTVEVTVTDPSMFTADDTLRIVGVHGVTDYKGTAYSGDNIPDLILKVVEIKSNGHLECYAVNGTKIGDQPIGVPAVTKAATPQTIVRLGKACGELDVQTGRFANIPTATEQYCQNFMMQVEQSTFDKISEKNVDWSFSDLEEDGIYDMRLGMEGSFLFGDMGKIKHSSKNGMYTWFTKGIWWMAGKDLAVGTYDSTNGLEISDDDLVDLAKDLFVGTGSGSKRKVLLCGSDMLAELSKIKSDKFRLKDTVEVWNLKFKSWDTDFGEILTIHHELFDLNGMSNYGFALDPEYLGKKKFLNWTRNVLDLKTAGIRNTDAVVLQEASALYLRYPKAHARLHLATSADA